MRVKIILFAAVISFSTLGSVIAQSTNHHTGNENGIQFFQGSWNEALALAEKENKPIVLDVYARQNMAEEAD